MPEDDSTPTPQQVQDYYNAAEGCIEDGLDSPSCDKSKIAQQAAIAAGVDPELVESLEDCFDDPDSDACAKAAAKLAAVSACTAATEGAGAQLCSQFAPVVVDMIWPLVGPVVGPVWSWAISLAGTGLDAVEGFGKVLGFDFSTEAEPGLADEGYWKVQSATTGQLRAAYEQSVDALVMACRSSAEQLELDTVWPASLIGNINPGGVHAEPIHAGQLQGSMSDMLDDASSNANVDDDLLEDLVGEVDPQYLAVRKAMILELERWLKLEPDWSDEIDIEKSKVYFGKNVRRIVKFPKRTGTSFSYKCGSDANGEWSCTGWDPGRFWYVSDGWSWGNDVSMLADLASYGMARRAQGLRRATSKAIGSVVQKQTMRADRQRLEQASSESGSSSTLLLLGLVAAAVGGGIWLWNKKH